MEAYARQATLDSTGAAVTTVVDWFDPPSRADNAVAVVGTVRSGEVHPQGATQTAMTAQIALLDGSDSFRLARLSFVFTTHSTFLDSIWTHECRQLGPSLFSPPHLDVNA